MRIRRRRWRWPLLPRVVYLLAAVVLVLILVEPVERTLYPVPYARIVLGAAHQYGTDPYLVLAVMRAESRFDAHAVSKKGAIGLMQIMPQTGFWAARQLGLAGFSANSLYTPRINVTIGAWYLGHLSSRFGHNIAQVAAAYNGGLHNVQSWLGTHAWNGTAAQAGRIPFPETRNFVQNVLHNYRTYHRLYPNLAQNGPSPWMELTGSLFVFLQGLTKRP